MGPVFYLGGKDDIFPYSCSHLRYSIHLDCSYILNLAFEALTWLAYEKAKQSERQL